jgi:hypothetical protein
MPHYEVIVCKAEYGYPPDLVSFDAVWVRTRGGIWIFQIQLTPIDRQDEPIGLPVKFNIDYALQVANDLRTVLGPVQIRAGSRAINVACPTWLANKLELEFNEHRHRQHDQPRCG